MGLLSFAGCSNDDDLDTDLSEAENAICQTNQIEDDYFTFDFSYENNPIAKENATTILPELKAGSLLDKGKDRAFSDNCNARFAESMARVLGYPAWNLSVPNETGTINFVPMFKTDGDSINAIIQFGQSGESVVTSLWEKDELQIELRTQNPDEARKELFIGYLTIISALEESIFGFSTSPIDTLHSGGNSQNAIPDTGSSTYDRSCCNEEYDWVLIGNEFVLVKILTCCHAVTSGNSSGSGGSWWAGYGFEGPQGPGASSNYPSEIDAPTINDFFAKNNPCENIEGGNDDNTFGDFSFDPCNAILNSLFPEMSNEEKIWLENKPFVKEWVVNFLILTAGAEGDLKNRLSFALSIMMEHPEMYNFDSPNFNPLDPNSNSVIQIDWFNSTEEEKILWTLVSVFLTRTEVCLNNQAGFNPPSEINLARYIPNLPNQYSGSGTEAQMVMDFGKISDIHLRINHTGGRIIELQSHSPYEEIATNGIWFYTFDYYRVGTTLSVFAWDVERDHPDTNLFTERLHGGCD